MKKIIVTSLAIMLAISTPAIAQKKPTLTPLEVQALQSKEFETTKEDAFTAVMTVFQDLGYQIDTADMQTGLITANSATEIKTSLIEAFASMSSSGNTRATAFIHKTPVGGAKIRLNFLNTKKSSTRYGQDFQKDTPILDAAVYTNVWDKIDEALFMTNAVKAPAPAPNSTPLEPSSALPTDPSAPSASASQN